MGARASKPVSRDGGTRSARTLSRSRIPRACVLSEMFAAFSRRDSQIQPLSSASAFAEAAYDDVRDEVV